MWKDFNMKRGEKVDISTWISASFWKSAYLKMNSVSPHIFLGFLNCLLFLASNVLSLYYPLFSYRTHQMLSIICSKTSNRSSLE